MADQSGEKTEKPTQARRDEFRKQGQVAQTRELATAATLIFTSFVLYGYGRYIMKIMIEVFDYTFGDQMVLLIRGGSWSEAASFLFSKSAYMLVPMLLLAGVIGFFSTVLQVGFLKVEDAVSPNLEKISPIEGFKRVFSLKSLFEGFKSILKLLAVGVIVYFLLKNEVQQIPWLSEKSIPELVVYIGKLLVKLLGGIGALMLVVAAGDYFFQRWQLEKRMMMSKQEVKEEHKQREGDPMIRARIRRLQRERATRRMMDAIPKADVVITNPTHIAVVLNYDDKLPAPQLVAKGADLVAEKIRNIAREHNIPIVENKPLARTIYKTMKLGQVIPKELFVAVAEVLSFVFKLRSRRKSL